MMHLAGRGGEGRAGIRMGVWGAAQAIAFGLGRVGRDSGGGPGRGSRSALRRPAAYGLVFAADALLFLWAAILAVRLPGERGGGGM
jgi:BCD family chlorophyll transporter-like MFS transporter